ncbi:kinase-like protein, partial [Caulochytrium protostelioides]
MLSQRHSSSNFIHKIDSAEVIWMANKSSIKLIGSYLLGKQIGKGSFGKVKEGLCSETLQRVAIKIINKTRVKRSANGIQGVIQEIKLLKRLKHPNVITLIDVFCKVQAVDDEEQVGIFNWFSTIEDEPILWQMEDGTQEEHHVEVLKWYLVFEYCPCSLQTLIDQSSENLLATGQGQRFFQQLMQGVDYLHSQNIVHRDIKPGNMLITPDGVLKITDFGIAEQFSMYDMKPMRINNFAGTHQFLSPEITAGSLSFDGPKADVWACGITLYYMLTRRFPFDFDEELNLLSLYERIANGAFEMPAEFPADLQELMTQILHRDPKLRASVQDVLKHAWAQKPVLLTLKTLEPFLTYPVPPEEAAPSTPVSPLKMPVLPGQPAPKGKAAPPPRPVVPCITTLIPYLEELFMEEIEQTLATRGSLGTYGFVPASKSAPTSP